MNTANMVYSNRVVRRGHGAGFFQRISITSILVSILIVFSAFSITYYKDLNRRLFIQYQQLMSQQQRSQVQWGRLLLEESAWSTQARIQRLAEERLQMFLPVFRNIVMVELNNDHNTATIGSGTVLPVKSFLAQDDSPRGGVKQYGAWPHASGLLD